MWRIQKIYVSRHDAIRVHHGPKSLKRPANSPTLGQRNELSPLEGHTSEHNYIHLFSIEKII